MQNSANRRPFFRQCLFPAKTKLVMKLITVFMLSASISVSAGVNSQNITLSGKNLNLENIFSVIKNQTGYAVFYNVELISAAKPVSLSVKKMPLAGFLELVLKDQNLEARISGKTISLYEKKVPVTATDLPTINITPVIPPVIVQGTILGEGGKPLQGVSVSIKGTNKGVTSDEKGKYSITVPDKDNVLVFSYIGYAVQERAAGNLTNIDIVLVPNVQKMDEIVVTALGISKAKKALGYATQEVSGESIKKSAEPNLVNALSGKVAGVYINSSNGAVGASSRITIRGNNSLRLDNQPLFVVDGIPVGNSQTSLNANQISVDYGNAAADINPADIETLTVLKGANATALYGSRGANGVIVITTKTGAKNAITVTAESTTSFQTPQLLPTYQNEYGQGNQRQFWYKDGKNGGRFDGVDESTGPRLDYIVKAEDLLPGGELYWTVVAKIPQTVGQLLVLPQFNSPLDANGNRIPTPWISHPDNVKSFFQTGITSINNVAISNSGSWGNMRLSLTNSYQKGTIPNTDQKKNTFNFSGLSNLSKKFTVEFKGSYMNIHSDNLPGAGYTANNPMMQTIWTGRQVDWEWERNNYRNPDGTQINWISIYHDNPYWMANMDHNPMTRNRFIGSAVLKYKLTDWLDLQGRVGTDFSSERFEIQRSYYGNVNPEGYWNSTNSFRQETNSDILLSGRRKIKKDITISGNIGANIMNQKQKNDGIVVNKLVVPGIYSIANAKEPAIPSYAIAQKEIQSVYAAFSADYKGQLFLDVTGRNDWSSTLPSNNNSYFYPSVTGSWIFSESMHLNGKILSYGKVRMSWAQVGNDANPYMTQRTFTYSQPFGSNPSYSQSSVLPPTNLKNELQTSTEFGAELKFLKNRIGIDFTVYKSNTRNQILNVTTSPTSGDNSQTINAGEVENRGIEVILTGTPVKTNNFSWDVTVNWSKNQNKIVSLAGDLASYQLSNLFNWVTVVAPVGGAYGTMMGRGYVYDANGNIVVGANGIPLTTAGPVPLGNIMPDWIGGIMNTIRYKAFTFNFLIDARVGGKLFSRTNWNGWQTGALQTSVQINPRGVSMREPLSRNGGILLDGVFADGKPNNVYVDFYSNAFNNFARAERWLYSSDFIKLREIGMSYSLPVSIANRLKLKGVDLSLFARNVAILHKKIPNIDPEVSASNSDISSQGGEYAGIPASRNIGFSIKLSF
jgi:TonB-linked SusC/RagA family outer membrane protein